MARTKHGQPVRIFALVNKILVFPVMSALGLIATGICELDTGCECAVMLERSLVKRHNYIEKLFWTDPLVP